MAISEKQFYEELKAEIQSFKGHEQSRTQTFFYGLIAVGVYAFFQLKDSDYCQPVIIISLILGVYGYYRWYLTEMLNLRAAVASRRFVRVLDDNPTDEHLPDMVREIVQISRESTRGHVFTLGAAVLSCMLLILSLGLSVDSNSANEPLLIIAILTAIGAVVLLFLNHRKFLAGEAAKLRKIENPDADIK